MTVELIEGSAFKRRYLLQDEAGVALNLTGALSVGIFMYQTGNATAIFIKTAANGGLVVIGAPSAGLVEITLSGADTEDKAGHYNGEARVTLSDSTPLKRAVDNWIITAAEG